MDELEALLEAVRKSAKYREVCTEVIRGIGAQELSKGRGFREAVKATKGKLHQVGAAYLAGRLSYGRWLEQLELASRTGQPGHVRAVCREAMRSHSSTRERLSILERFFAETLGPLAPISSVLDVACGLNPLAIPWMPLASSARYYGCEMYTDMAEFLNAALPLLGVHGTVEARDVTRSPPTVKADVALILKSLPCLEQVAPSSSARLLSEVRCDILLVTYPVKGQGWSVKRLVFETELAFIVNKNPA